MELHGRHIRLVIFAQLVIKINFFIHNINEKKILAEDSQALIWDVHQIPRPVEDPILAYAANAEVLFFFIRILKIQNFFQINQVHWSSTLTDWISICYDKSLELLRV